MTVFVGITVAMTRHGDQKQAEEERAYLAYTSTSQTGQELTRGGNLQAEADAEAVEGCCLLACSS